MKVLSNKLVKKSIKVYDFTVQDHHHYILSNGIVSHNTFFPENEVAGGGGVKYSASTIIVLGKKKEKDGKEVIGNIIRLKNYKSRFTKENATADSMLNYSMGLDRYYGLLEIGQTDSPDSPCQKIGAKWKVGDNPPAFQKAIYKTPEKYFTTEVLKEIDKVAGKKFKYGSGQSVENEEPINLPKKVAKRK